jgi:membrane associated rhomboid family serine protease
MNAASVGFQCPECVSDGRRTVRQRRTAFGGTLAGVRGRVTIVLIAINVAVEIASIYSAHGKGLFGGGLGGLLGGDTPLVDAWSMIGKGEFVDSSTGQHLVGPYGVSNGEYYRIITSMFVHLGPLHLLMNMWALWIVGRAVEAALGPLRYLILYFLAGIGGSVSVMLFSPFPGGAGASGAIFGLFAALFVILRRLGQDTSALIPLLVINALFSLAPGISLAAHAGGFVTGGVVAAVMAYSPRQHRNVYTGTAVAAVLMLFTFAIVVSVHMIQAAGLHPI